MVLWNIILCFLFLWPHQIFLIFSKNRIFEKVLDIKIWILLKNWKLFRFFFVDVSLKYFVIKHPYCILSLWSLILGIKNFLRNVIIRFAFDIEKKKNIGLVFIINKVYEVFFWFFNNKINKKWKWWTTIQHS